MFGQASIAFSQVLFSVSYIVNNIDQLAAFSASISRLEGFQGKVEAITELARWEGLALDQCYAYSDSASDLPMLQAVGHPVAVNPDAKLERHARRNGWPIVIFSRRTKAVVRRTSEALGATALAAGSFAVGVRWARSR